MKHLTITLCLTLAVLLGSVGVSWGADFQKGLAAAQNGDFATALREWTPLAEQGHADAQNNLGVMYQYGEGVPQDYKTALKWYTLAAEQGLDLAQFNLGVFYKNGLGVPQDNLYAYMWLQIAATSGRKKASELRDIVAKEMTPAQIEKAEKLASECIAKKFKGC